jgi:hypothetical protein
MSEQDDSQAKGDGTGSVQHPMNDGETPAAAAGDSAAAPAKEPVGEPALEPFVEPVAEPSLADDIVLDDGGAELDQAANVDVSALLADSGLDHDARLLVDETAAEPVLDGAGSASPADLEFVEPELGSAEISADVAESVALDQVEAEAARLAREAETSAELPVADVLAAVPPPSDESLAAMGAPADAPAPGESVPAESVPAESAAAEPGPTDSDAPAPERVSRDGAGWHRPDTPWQPKANAWQSSTQAAEAQQNAPTPPVARTYQAAVTGQDGAGQQTLRPRGQTAVNDGSKGNGKVFIVVGLVLLGLVMLGLFIWLIVGLVSQNSGSAAGSAATSSQDSSASLAAANSPSVIEAQVSPLKWMVGDCLRGYTTPGKPADVVKCNSPHSAQLVATFSYQKADAFPGLDALKARGQTLCKSVQYTKVVDRFKGLRQTPVYPSAGTWNNSGDRRVDCLVFDPSGDNITASLIQ